MWQISLWPLCVRCLAVSHLAHSKPPCCRGRVLQLFRNGQNIDVLLTLLQVVIQNTTSYRLLQRKLTTFSPDSVQLRNKMLFIYLLFIFITIVFLLNITHTKGPHKCGHISSRLYYYLKYSSAVIMIAGMGWESISDEQWEKSRYYCTMRALRKTCWNCFLVVDVTMWVIILEFKQHFAFSETFILGI